MPSLALYCCLVRLQQLREPMSRSHWQMVHQDEHAATGQTVTAQTDPVDGSEDRTHTAPRRRRG